MKKAIKPIFIFLGGIAAVSLPPFAFAATTLSISGTIPGMTSVASTNPGSWINSFYSLALMLGGILAFGAVVYGGVLYAASAGNSSRQSEGKQWIWAALTGLLLLAGAWLILNTINPSLTNISFPTLSSLSAVPPPPSGGVGGNPATSGGTGSGLTQSQAQTELSAAGIMVISSGSCSDPNNPNCTSLVGMQQSTIDELVSLRSTCGCTVTVTGGTEVGHAAGDYSHANGYKADIDPNAAASAYIQSNFTPAGIRASDGAQQFKDPATGAIYAREATHWDITVPGSP